jgi:hypothetical protein
MYVPEWTVSEEEDLTFAAKDPEYADMKTEGN